MSNDLSGLERIIRYPFNNRAFLRRALTHASYAHQQSIKDNQRLEFLGDAVLGLVITDIIYRKFPDKKEGDLSKLRSSLVNRATLAQLAKTLNLGLYLRLGRGENEEVKHRPSTLSDAFEALIGAVFFGWWLAQGQGNA